MTAKNAKETMNLDPKLLETLWHTLGIREGEPIIPRDQRRNYYCQGDRGDQTVNQLVELGLMAESPRGANFYWATQEGERLAAEIHAKRWEAAKLRWFEFCVPCLESQWQWHLKHGKAAGEVRYKIFKELRAIGYNVWLGSIRVRVAKAAPIWESGRWTIAQKQKPGGGGPRVALGETP